MSIGRVAYSRFCIDVNHASKIAKQVTQALKKRQNNFVTSGALTINEL